MKSLPPARFMRIPTQALALKPNSERENWESAFFARVAGKAMKSALFSHPKRPPRQCALSLLQPKEPAPLPLQAQASPPALRRCMCMCKPPAATAAKTTAPPRGLPSHDPSHYRCESGLTADCVRGVCMLQSTSYNDSLYITIYTP
jgi:hypothetical protein